MAFKKGNRTKTQWAPGQSGNPAGRSAAAQRMQAKFEDLLEKILNKKGELKLSDGTVLKRSNLEILLWAGLKRAVGGSDPALDMMMKRIAGMPRQTVDVAGAVPVTIHDDVPRVVDDAAPEETPPASQEAPPDGSHNT